MNNNNCNKEKCNINKSSGNGKGDAPRNNHSKQFKKNYDQINWTKKTQNKKK